jgi:hypothetical protein
MGTHFWILLETSFSIHFLTSLSGNFVSKLYYFIKCILQSFSGSITYKLTVLISKFTCILVFFRSCEQKLNFLYRHFFFKNSVTDLNFHQIQKYFRFCLLGDNPSNKTPAIETPDYLIGRN